MKLISWTKRTELVKKTRTSKQIQNFDEQSFETENDFIELD